MNIKSHNWIKTYTNKHIDYNNLDPNQICITDIAHHLSLENRFMGQSEAAYSVANHLLFCLAIAKHLGYTPYLCLRVLMHDFAEAYVKDIPTPLKRLLPDFMAVEARFEWAIEEWFGLPELSETEKDLVKRVDLIALKMEKEALLNCNDDWAQLDGVTTVPITLKVLSPKTAEAELKQAFHRAYEAVFNVILSSTEIEQQRAA
ncbi:hypothetical protein FHQ28_05360 [Pasteurellaceae bacterium USgator11]|nr:hypothetical protein FHQ19_09440 [Pasteurellaceae bacterium UScroc12]TNG94743.1 hypothetical protein FHQ20_08100 [Pasteurellaceae bacterium USgator41]TNG97714.1 hypothetical protein FHQ24_09890 [Pasteurellaceae bacterium UScroc31]TNH01675.1 hypothetical protein FHQ28_05360 [Pasteurellaceae bacterium USgator11]